MNVEDISEVCSSQFLPDTTRFSEKKNEELMVDLRVEKCVDIDIWFHFLNGFE